MSPIQRVLAPVRSIFSGPRPLRTDPDGTGKTAGAILEDRFPVGYHVYGFSPGPDKDWPLLVGAGDPLDSKGAVVLGDGRGHWNEVRLPDDTALVSRFIRMENGVYLAGGMNSIGRASILMGDATARIWQSVEMDLHPFCAIADMVKLPDGAIVVSAGRMITQGKTKPILFRSTDRGYTWERLDLEGKVSATVFQSFAVAEDGTVYAGTAGDHTPTLYRSFSGGLSWEPLPPFPAYKTYKTVAARLVRVDGVERLYVVLWGYRVDLSERVVRLYRSTPGWDGWEELSPVNGSQFVFSFLVASDGSFFLGSEKGQVLRSEDAGLSWKVAAQFGSNVGAYALHQDESGRIWIGKDYVAPSEYSLWRLP